MCIKDAHRITLITETDIAKLLDDAVDEGKALDADRSSSGVGAPPYSAKYASMTMGEVGHGGAKL